MADKMTLVQAVEEMRDCLAEDHISQRGVVGAHNVVCWIDAIDAHIAAMGEPVAWVAFADNNGPVPLELYGWDKKACKNAVLVFARTEGWKGTLEGYLTHTGWVIRPLYLAAQPTPGDWDKVREVIAILDADGDEWGCAAKLTAALPESQP